MIDKLFNFFRRPPYGIRVSPQTKKLEIVPVAYLDIYDPLKHGGDSDNASDYYNLKQFGNREDEEE